MNALEERDELKELALLSVLSSDDRDLVEEHLVVRDVAAGEVIFNEGDAGDAIVFLASGTVRLESRRSAEIGYLGPGAALGTASIVSPGPREATVIADTECRVLLLPRAGFQRLVEEAPRTACRIVAWIVEDLVTSLRTGLDRAGFVGAIE